MSDVRTPVIVLLLVLASATAGFAGVGAAQQDQVALTITVETEDGQTVGNANLSLSWDGGSKNATTRSNGQVIVDVPAGENVSVDIDDDEYIRNSPYVVEDASSQSVTVEVAPQGTATVTVEASDGAVENARVSLYDGTTRVTTSRTNESGVVTTDPVEQGSYSLLVYKAGFLQNRSSIDIDDSNERTVEISRDTVLVTFNVTDDHFSPAQSIQDATVDIDSRGSLTTSETGQASLTLPVNTRYSVTVTKTNYTNTTKRPFVGESDRTVDVDLNREPSLSIVADNSQMVVNQTNDVTVTDEYGEAVPNATVSVNGTVVAETDADGTLEVPISSVGNTTISVTDGNSSASVVVEVIPRPSNEQPATTTTTTTMVETTTTEAVETTTPEQTTAAGGGADETTTQPATNTGGPGFTPLVALAALLVALALLARRQ
jgi:PGF-CTERM protein